MISAIVAHSTNHVIGKDNKLPRHYPKDLQHFKNITTGKTVLMGRKTFESIGRPLPHRKNIVLTRNTDRTAPGVDVAHNFHDILNTYQTCDEELIVIGGQQIYELFLPYTTKLYITVIKEEVEGDTYFPQYTHLFDETAREKHDKFDFVEYERRTITGPYVGIGIAVLHHGKMLFGKRISDHVTGVRSRPGGKLDAGETREACAAREAYEETGIHIKNIRYLQTTNNIYPDEGKHFITIRMTSELKSGTPQVMEPDKFEKRERFDIHKLPDPVFPGVPEVIKHFFE